MRIGVPESASDRVRVELCFDAGEPMRTSDFPDAAARILSLLPGLRGHRCDNGAGATFAQELADTELAHLLEHVTLEIMALAGAPDTLSGATSWDFATDGTGVFRVSIEHDDEATARSALAIAGEIVAWSVGAREEAPSLETDVRGLRRHRESARPPA